MTDSTSAAAAEAENDYAPSWRPEAGDTIKGTVTGTKLGPDFGYGPYPIMTLDTGEGEQAVHAMHQVLRSELAQRRPRTGDVVEITYLGTRRPKSGNGNPFHVYRVKGGQEPEFDWTSELPDGQRPSEGDVPIAPSTPLAAGEVAARERRERAEATSQAAAETYGDDVPF